MNAHTEKYRILKKALCLAVSCAFLFNFVLSDAWAVVAAAPGGMPFAAMPDKLAQFDVGTFAISPDLGLVKYVNKGGSDKLMIHIQDAHCNYAAQHKISDIIEHLNSEYGIETVNLEGGAGEYDLSGFTRIYNKDIRRDVADYFVRWGEVNGAEFFALNNPDKVQLWGIENADAYIKNLDVYRNSFEYKDEADKYLEELDQPVSALKKHIFSEELLELDNKYSQYKSNAIEFKDYLSYLIKSAKERGINTRSFPNLYLLGHSIEEEDKIDFKKANNERDELISKLQKRLSKNDLAELVSKTVQFRNKGISQGDFFEYLVKKADQAKISLEDFPDLRMYIIYVSLYNAADKTMVMQEMEGIESEIKEALFQNDNQRQLDLLSKNLILTRNIFDIAFTKEDYAYYKENKASFDVRNFVSFIKKEAPVYGMKVDLDRNIGRLDRFRGRMFDFYERSFARDNAFMENIRFSGDKVKAGIIVTGGFHTENLLEKFKENDISYVSIIPSFRNEEGYESPYFSVLSGGVSPLEEAIETALSTIQVASIFNKLGMDLSGDRRIRLFELAKEVLTERRSAVKAASEVKDTGVKNDLLSPRVFTLTEGQGYIAVTVDEQGNVDFRHVPAGDTISFLDETGKPEDFLIDRVAYDPTNLQSMRDAFSDITGDRSIADAKDVSQAAEGEEVTRRYLNKDSDGVKGLLKSFAEGNIVRNSLDFLLAKRTYVDTRGPEPVVQTPTYNGREIYTGIQEVTTLNRIRKGHVGQAIYISTVDENGEPLEGIAKEALILHEIVAGLYFAGTVDGELVVGDDLAKAVQNMYESGRSDRIEQINRLLDDSKSYMYHTPLWEMTPSERKELSQFFEQRIREGEIGERDFRGEGRWRPDAGMTAIGALIYGGFALGFLASLLAAGARYAPAIFMPGINAIFSFAGNAAMLVIGAFAFVTIGTFIWSRFLASKSATDRINELITSTGISLTLEARGQIGKGLPAMITTRDGRVSYGDYIGGQEKEIRRTLKKLGVNKDDQDFLLKSVLMNDVYTQQNLAAVFNNLINITRKLDEALGKGEQAAKNVVVRSLMSTFRVDRTYNKITDMFQLAILALTINGMRFTEYDTSATRVRKINETIKAYKDVMLSREKAAPEDEDKARRAIAEAKKAFATTRTMGNVTIVKGDGTVQPVRDLQAADMRDYFEITSPTVPEVGVIRVDKAKHPQTGAVKTMTPEELNEVLISALDRPHLLSEDAVNSIKAFNTRLTEGKSRVIALKAHKDIRGFEYTDAEGNNVLCINEGLIERGNKLAHIGIIHEGGESRDIDIPESDRNIVIDVRGIEGIEGKGLALGELIDLNVLGEDFLHTYYRGTGERVRIAMDILVKQMGAENVDLLVKMYDDAILAIDAVVAELETVMEKYNLRPATGNKITDNEKVRMALNWGKWRDMGFSDDFLPIRGRARAERLTYGFTDELDPTGNRPYTMRMKGLRGDFTRNVVDIQMSPGYIVDTKNPADNATKEIRDSLEDDGVQSIRRTWANIDEMKRNIRRAATVDIPNFLREGRMPQVSITPLTNEEVKAFNDVMADLRREGWVDSADRFLLTSPDKLYDTQRAAISDGARFPEARLYELNTHNLAIKRLIYDKRGLEETDPDALEANMRQIQAHLYVITDLGLIDGIALGDIPAMTAAQLAETMNNLFTGVMRYNLDKFNWEQLSRSLDAMKDVAAAL